MSGFVTSPSGNSMRAQPEHGRDLMVNRWGEVAFVVAHGYGADALRLWDKVTNAQHRRRYTDAARANVALMELPGYAEAECDENGDAYMPSRYPAPAVTP